jgi:hypothetical protein
MESGKNDGCELEEIPLVVLENVLPCFESSNFTDNYIYSLAGKITKTALGHALNTYPSDGSNPPDS